MSEKKNKLQMSVLMTIGVAAVSTVLYLIFLYDNDTQTTGVSSMDQKDPSRYSEVSGKKGQVEIYLYFANADSGFLSSEKRNILRPEDPAGFGKRIVQELLKGPHGNLNRTIPEHTSLRAFYISSDGIAYVDFSQEIKDLYPGGSHSEYLTLYSIVNSIVYNVPDIKAVKILVNGNEATTLAGHIGIGSPIRADMVMVR